MKFIRQPVPEVTAEDVQRIVRRDFPQPEFDTVMAVLHEYGREEWHTSVDRVRMAALKLADGDIQKLRQEIDVARIDFRDIVVPAEYPLYMQTGSQMRNLPEQEKRKIIDADWKQYQDWLHRDPA